MLHVSRCYLHARTDLVLDNTNSSNLELYSILGEYDNAGFPLVYCFLTTAQAVEQGKRKRALEAWGRQLKERYNIYPLFVHVDKDLAEIGMVKEVWPKAKISLCWWHMRKALRERLSKAKLSTTPYTKKRAHAAHILFNFIDPDFRPAGRPDKTEFEGGKPDDDEEEEENEMSSQRLWATQTTIKLPPMSQQIVLPLTIRIPAPQADWDSDNSDSSDKESQRRFCPKHCRQPIIDMMEDAYCAHPLIPGYAADHPKAIYEWAIHRIYDFCIKNSLPEVWAYLWMNWLRPERWSLWARSTYPEMIPVLKTTMMVESQ